METLTKIPLTLSERIEYGEVMQIPASWEEFLHGLEYCQYRIEYDEGEIFSFMGYASETHELLVAQMIRLLGNLLLERHFKISGSNLALHIPGIEKRYFNADCTVVKGSSQKVSISKGMEAVSNPILLVEVLSPSTENHDVGRKFRHYRKIESLQQVLFISSTKKEVINQKRVKDSNEWLLQEFQQDNNTIQILDEGFFSLEEIYYQLDL